MICVVCLFASDPRTSLADVREAITVVAGMASCGEHIAGLATSEVLVKLTWAHQAVKAATT